MAILDEAAHAIQLHPNDRRTVINLAFRSISQATDKSSEKSDALVRLELTRSPPELA
jgi:hypothetical protein